MFYSIRQFCGIFGMIKKSTLEKVMSEDLAELWSVLSQDEKHIVVDNFVIHNFKKNHIRTKRYQSEFRDGNSVSGQKNN